MKIINEILAWKVQQMLNKLKERSSVVQEIKYH